jgi:SAM-dependent methyltransferase
MEVFSIKTTLHKKNIHMSTEVPYSKQTLQTPNPVARYAHGKRYKIGLDKVKKNLKDYGSLLDYGCGEGDFLYALSELMPDATLFGYDPYSGHIPEQYIGIDEIDHVKNKTVDIVCCFETLEHLYPHERDNFYKDAHRILIDDGRIIISVPIIGGPPLLLKEINRMVLFQRESEYSLKELLLTSFLGKPAKKPDDPHPTHKGFDFRELERELYLHFKVYEKSFSPFPSLPWWLNSQVFYSLTKHPTKQILPSVVSRAADTRH